MSRSSARRRWRCSITFRCPTSSNDPKKNYHFSSAAESDQDIFSLRLTHNFGAVPQRGQQGAVEQDAAAAADVRATISTSASTISAMSRRA